MELMFLLLTIIPEALGNLCTGLQSAVIPHPNSCKKFVICDEEQPTVLTCPGDLYFDIVIRSCILHSLAHCGPKHASTTTTTPLPYRSITPSTMSASTATSFESLPPISPTGMWRSLPPMSTTESSDSSEVEPSALPPILTSEPYPYSKPSESTTSDHIITTSSIMNTSYTENISHYTSPTLIHSTSSSEFVDLSTITDAPLMISTTSHMDTTASTVLNSEQSSVSETTKNEPTTFPSTFSPETTYSDNNTTPSEDFTTRKTSGMTSSTGPSTISDETPLITDMFNTSASLSSVTYDDVNSPTIPNSDNIVSSETLPPINYSSNTPTLLTESDEPMIETTHTFVTTTVSNDDDDDDNKITPSALSSTLSEINNTYTTPIDYSEMTTGQPGSSLPPISTQRTHDSSVTSSPSIFSSTIFQEVTETVPTENIPSSTYDITSTSSFSESESDLVSTSSIFDQSTKNGTTNPTNMRLFDSSTTFKPSLSPSTTSLSISSSETDFETNAPNKSSSLVYSTEIFASTPTSDFTYPTLPSLKTSSLSTNSDETIPPMPLSTTLISTVNPSETTPSQISTSMSQSTFDQATTSDIPMDQTITTKLDVSTSMTPFIPTTITSTPITEHISHSSEVSGTTEPISSLQTSSTQEVSEESSSINPTTFSESTTDVTETDNFSTNVPIKPSSHLPTTNLPPISSTITVPITQSTAPLETSYTTDIPTTTDFMSTTLTTNLTELSTYPYENSTITLPISSTQTSVMPNSPQDSSTIYPLINSESTTDISLDNISEITTSDELSSLAPITDATRLTHPSILTTHVSASSSVTISPLNSSSTTRTTGSIDSISTTMSSIIVTGPSSSYPDGSPTSLTPEDISTSSSLFTTETSSDVEPSSLLPITKETPSPQTNPTIPPISTTPITSPTTISVAPTDITTNVTNIPIDSISTTVPSTLLTESNTHPNNILSTIMEESSSPTNVSSGFPEIITATAPLIISETTTEITENGMSPTNATIEPSSPNPITHVTEPPTISSTSFETTPSTIITESTEDMPEGSPLPPIPTSESDPPSPLPPLPEVKMSTLPPQTTTDTLLTTTLIPCHPYRYYTLVNPESTRTFYYCVLGTRYLFNCPHKYEFDPVTHVCTNP